MASFGQVVFHMENSGGTEIQNLKINSFLPGELHRGNKKKQDEDFMRSALQMVVN